jgi:hypothetical protein
MRYGVVLTRRFRLLRGNLIATMRSRGLDPGPFQAWFRQLTDGVSSAPPPDAAARRAQYAEATLNFVICVDYRALHGHFQVEFFDLSLRTI